NELEPIAKPVYLHYRQEALKGHEAQISHLKTSSVQFLLHTSIEKLIAADDHEQIKTVVLKNNQDDALFDLAIAEV
ncbi:thioredoxin reductase, partial [Bacillus pumilus]